jgi:hypothetical protein
MNTIWQDGVFVCIPSAPEPYAAIKLTAANV